MIMQQNTLYGKIFVAACLVVGFLLIWTVSEENTADELRKQIVNERLSHIEDKVYGVQEMSLDTIIDYDQRG